MSAGQMWGASQVCAELRISPGWDLMGHRGSSEAAVRTELLMGCRGEGDPVAPALGEAELDMSATALHCQLGLVSRGEA